MLKKLLPIFLLITLGLSVSYSQIEGQTRLEQNFELRLKDKHKNSDAETQLASNDFNGKKKKTSLKNFDHVEKITGGDIKTELSKPVSLVLKNKTSEPKRLIEIWFHNFYDSYQENYIANLVMHFHFRLGPKFYAGPYLDVYTDSRSTKEVIYNDRFFELGVFLRYYILPNLYFEGRIGYARQLIQDTNTINLKPMLVYFNRFGDAKEKLEKNDLTKSNLYMDFYYALMYDYKYRNAFFQATMTQVIRFYTGGYSYIENYLFESGQFDSRRLSYNNYFEVGAGLRFKPNVRIFPVFFIEPTYKVYFFGETKNSFQIKAGFWFYMNNPL